MSQSHLQEIFLVWRSIFSLEDHFLFDSIEKLIGILDDLGIYVFLDVVPLNKILHVQRFRVVHLNIFENREELAD